MSLFTILSIDGGGIRGIIPAMVLADIERRTGRRISELFDLIAGTSTGGVLAMGLSVPEEPTGKRPRFEASQLVSFYEEDGKEIFRSFWRDVVSLHGLMEERYRSEPIEGVLQKYLGEETRLSQALTEILITSYEIETCRPYLFTRRKARATRGGQVRPAHVGSRPGDHGGPDVFLPVPDHATEALAPASTHIHRCRRLREQPHALRLRGGPFHAQSLDRRGGRGSARGVETERATRGGPIGGAGRRGRPRLPGRLARNRRAQ